jgi:HlyD family secretion protein
MDRELPAAEIRSAKRRKVAVAVVALAAAGAGYWALGSWLRPTVDRRDLRLAHVETGSIDSTLEAAGTVIPLEERLVTSPADATLLRVLHRAGDRVAPGEPILVLDVSGLEVERNTLAQQLAIKGNEARRAELASQHKLEGLEADQRRQRLSLAFLGAKRDQTEVLGKDGLASREALMAARLEVDLAKETLDSIEAQAKNARAAAAAELDGIALELGILKRELAELDRKLAFAKATSASGGTITFTLTEPGTRVHAGDVLARISDLSSFRVRATVSDMHASRIEAGMPAKVRVDGQTIGGRVTTVLPAVENGSVSFLVDPDNPSHPGLRASRRVDVEVVVDRREKTLVVRRGPGITGTGAQRLFVVKGDRAERRDVTVGLMNLDWCEIVSGVSAGDELILSDTRLWNSFDALALR